MQRRTPRVLLSASFTASALALAGCPGPAETTYYHYCATDPGRVVVNVVHCGPDGQPPTPLVRDGRTVPTFVCETTRTYAEGETISPTDSCAFQDDPDFDKKFKKPPKTFKKGGLAPGSGSGANTGPDTSVTS